MAHVEQTCAQKPRTVAFYRGRYKTLLSFAKLAGARLDNIDEKLVAEYANSRAKVQTRLKATITPASINRELAVLRRVLRLAHEWRLVGRVPKIRLLRGERVREFILEPEMEEQYLSACPDILKNVAKLLLDTGLRLNEALSLTWSDVHLEPLPGASYGYLNVRRASSKNSKSRNVPLSPRVTEMLKQLTAHSGEFVFARRDESRYQPSNLSQAHGRVRDALGLSSDFVLHSLRHTFGSRLGESGADAFAIMKLMGHSTVLVSQRYVHPSPEALELAFGRAICKESPQESHKSATVPAGRLQVID